MVWLPAKAYELAVRLRIAAYETEYLKSKRLDATVISVGNLTLGGTGKTPLVAYIARYLKNEGYSVAILTRGYRRSSNRLSVLNDPRQNNRRMFSAGSFLEYGDEPVMLARELPDIPVIVNADRYESGRWAERELGAQILILDDGYQYLALARDLNILALDAMNPFGNFKMVPLGLLREPLYSIHRAGAVVVTRAHLKFDQDQIVNVLHDCKTACNEGMPPVFYFSSEITALRHIKTGEVFDISEFAGWDATIICGIGNPASFREDLLRAGLNIAGEHIFRDHHVFSQDELDSAGKQALETGADMILTTEKDAVRLEHLVQRDVPVYAAKLRILSEDFVGFKSLLLRTAMSNTRNPAE